MRRRPIDPEAPVLLLETGSKSTIGLIKTLLDEADIKYAVVGDSVQDLFTIGRTGSDYNLATGPAKILVNRRDYDTAKDLIGEVDVSTTQRLPLWLRLVLLIFVLAPTLIVIILQIVKFFS